MAKLTTRKASIVKVGDTVLITGAHNIGQEKWNDTYPGGIFGRVIEVRPRYSQNDGSRYMDKIIVRCYVRRSRYDKYWHRSRRPHYETNNQYIKPYTVK